MRQLLLLEGEAPIRQSCTQALNFKCLKKCVDITGAGS